MQARELTAAEVEEGKQGITDRELTATQIQALVRQMDVSKKRHQRLKGSPRYEEALKKENTTLYFNYPSLFQLHFEDRLDQTFFEMLSLKRKIEKGEITPEQASAVVGQQLFNRFVPHVISNSAPPTPRMSYEDFYRSSNM
jgi:stalled ribosome alternative rescue factor ArfA